MKMRKPGGEWTRTRTKNTESHDPECLCCTEGPEAYVKKLVETIEKFGHAVVGTQIEVVGHMMSMTYTVGLSKVGLPELVIFGVGMRPATMILNTAVEMLSQGKIQPDVPVSEIANLPSVFKEVKPEVAGEFLNFARIFANKDPKTLQLVIPDPMGKFPWDEDFDVNFMMMQAPLYEL